MVRIHCPVLDCVTLALTVGLLFLGPKNAVAHGPGRALDLVRGYCGDATGQVVRAMTGTLGEGLSSLPFCYRLINREEFPVGVRLGVLYGETNESGTDVCLAPIGERKRWNDGLFMIDGAGCRNPGLVLSAKESRDIHGLWFFSEPSHRLGWVRHGQEDLLNRIRCVEVDAQPLRESDVHGGGVHVKSGHDINMARLLASEKSFTVEPEWAASEDSGVCDSLSEFLAKRMVAEKTLPGEGAGRSSEQDVAEPSFAARILLWLKEKGWMD